MRQVTGRTLPDLRVFSIMLPIAEEIQQRGIEQDWILQEGKMADIGQDPQAGARNCCGDIFRVLALDASSWSRSNWCAQARICLLSFDFAR